MTDLSAICSSSESNNFQTAISRLEPMISSGVVENTLSRFSPSIEIFSSSSSLIKALLDLLFSVFVVGSYL